MVYNMSTRHKYGELYPEPNLSKQRRYVLTTLHKDCGGQVLPGHAMLWKTAHLKQDGKLGCCMCLAQPLTEADTYQDYC